MSHRTASFVVLLALTLVGGGVAAGKPAAKKRQAEKEVMPLTLPGSEALLFRKVGETELRLHVVKPKDGRKLEKRVCFISFFGGGWSSGSPERSICWAIWAAGQGMVGVAPDYRTRSRYEGAPEDCVSDGRAAFRWVVKHAEELGIDPDRIVCHGGFAGIHVAAWTAIPKPDPGKDDPAAEKLPAALVLLDPVSDTKSTRYGGPKRFDNDAARAKACSVPDQMPEQMPPAMVFHATGITTVRYANSVALRDKLVGSGNRCELVTFQGLGHGYNSSKFGEDGKAADRKTRQDVIAFLRSLRLLPGQ